jgi:hypothetical protein
MQRFLPDYVERGLKTSWSRFVEWLREWTKPDTHGLVGGAVADVTRSKSKLMLENVLLRQQLIVLDRQVKRPELRWRERGSMLLLAACTPSAMRRYVIGAQTFGQAVSNSMALTAVGLATVLSAEVSQVVFSLALATLGTSRSSRRLLYTSLQALYN